MVWLCAKGKRGGKRRDMSVVLLVDTGYWFALFEPRDDKHNQATPKARFIERMTVAFPWPVLYETLNTRLIKNRPGIDRFERIIKRPNIRRIDDTPYREEALEKTFDEARGGRRSISLCDMVMRLMLEDTRLRIRALLTFNEKDFADVCRRAKVQLL
jgi:predicted nucleic acid-binding protein